MPLADTGPALLHTRSYDVASYRESDNLLRIRGKVQDIKPPGLYIEGDPDPMTIHEMVVDLVVEFPSMRIVEAGVVMETHPHEECPSIVGHYEKLIGLSIARGFTHRVRELFGGPRGGTHTTALLQAMAPVAIQSLWSMLSAQEGAATEGGTASGGAGDIPSPAAAGRDNGEVAVVIGARLSPEERRERMRFNLNTCHVWAEDGPMFSLIDQGEDPPRPIWSVVGLGGRGRDPEEWRSRQA
jgi:hypothetical protein